MEEIKTIFEIVGIIVGAVLGILSFGWWIGSKQQALLNMIDDVKEMLEHHIRDEFSRLERIERKIKRIEQCVNGKTLGS